MGNMKLKTPGACLAGFFIIMDMPRSMKCSEKSSTRSLALVIVSAEIAMSDS
jgi:hypothetical protein